MNDKKICFITCVNDDRQYKECLLYINNLNIPEGYEIDTISVKEAQSMAQGYNGAMKNTDAKYKVYLHQDTFIINKNFIYDVLRTFNSDKNIGMIGVVGAKTIPTNGIWWEPNYKYGQVYESHTGNMELLAFNEVKDSYEEVKAIDGLIMITQYDIPWREDVFDGWHFYDISQSVEFSLKEYKVVIPKQNETWCMHDCGLVKNTMDNMYINKFLNEYSKKIFPLVSILIPTYNRPKYFELALESVLNQTYKNIEIIIGDDSTNDETEKLVNENYLNKYNNIKYYHNVKNLGQFDNDLKLYDMANGEFINYLMDDDLFEKTKIQKMMNYFVNDINEDISLVTSHRAIIDGDGNIGSIFGNTDDIFKKDTIIGGIGFGNFILKTNFNCIGEPTTALFRKNKLNEPFGVYNTRRYGCNVDQASWFNLLSNGKAVFINEVLSYFRIHQGQQQNNIKIKLNGFTDYIHSLLTSKKKGFLLNPTDYLKAIYNCFNLCGIYIIKPLKDKNMEIQEYKNFNKYYNKLKDEKEKIEELKMHCKKLEQKSNYEIKNVEYLLMKQKNIEENDLFYFDREQAKKIVDENKNQFNKFINIAKYNFELKDYEQTARWCYEAAKFASENHPGFYTCYDIEKMLMKCANGIPEFKNIEVPKSDSKKRKVLHVLSEGYAVGGHTRLIKNWIQKDKESQHSLVTTWQIKTTPDWLLNEVEDSGGWTCSLEDIPNFIDRSAKLRKLAYEWADIVVLHIHMFDPIPVIAFGVKGGPPVLFMNHADHLFWIGNSIIDMLINFRNSGKDLSVKRRNVNKNFILPLPSSIPKYSFNYGESLREKIGINKDTVLLLTIASEYKFKSFGKVHYVDIAKKILKDNKNAMLIVIGPRNIGLWQEAYKETDGRILALGIKKDIEPYYAIADIYIDSYMIGSATSALDAGLRGLPIVSFANTNNLTLSFNDVSYDNKITSVNDFVEYVNKLINNKIYRKNVGINLANKIKNDHIYNWNNSLNHLYEHMQNINHNIYLNASNSSNTIDNSDLFLALFQKNM